MGMAIGGQRGVTSDPNIVPLIDVLLVLIIIFMVITPQVSNGLPTFVPQPAPPAATRPPNDSHAVVVQVMQGGKIAINHEQTEWDALGARLTSIFEQRADKVAFVQGAEEVPFEEVARAINIMREADIVHVGLITSQGLPGE